MGQIVVENAHSRLKISRNETSATAYGVLNDERAKFEWISIVFINDAYCKGLNRRYLSHHYPTDVLSFRLNEGEEIEGEVYVNLDRASVQARQHGVSFKNEVDRLVIHGLLHLLGYRDTTPALKVRMKQKEDEYLRTNSARNGRARKSH